METYSHKIQYYETDKMQITHHSNYLRFMEESRMDFLDKHGFGYEKMEQEGIVSPLVDISCSYKSPTTYGDTIIIKIDVIGLTPIKLKLGYTMTVGEKTVCIATSTHCFLNKENKVLSLKKIYPDLYNIFNEMLNTYQHNDKEVFTFSKCALATN